MSITLFETVFALALRSIDLLSDKTIPSSNFAFFLFLFLYFYQIIIFYKHFLTNFLQNGLIEFSEIKKGIRGFCNCPR